MWVALHGSYFGHNFGDILLLSLYTKWIKEARKDCEVVLPQAPAGMLATIGADIRGFGGLLRARALIYAGGGYFGEPPGSMAHIQRWSARNFCRHVPSGGVLTAFGRPIAIIGVGAGPLSNPAFRFVARNFFERAVMVTVRDEESREFLRGIGVSRCDLEVTADSALHLSIKDIPEKHITDIYAQFRLRTDSMVGLHIPASAAYSDRIETIIECLEEIMSDYRQVEIVVLSDNPAHDPQRYAGRIAARYPNRVHVARYEDPWKLVALISQLRMVVTTKLHVGIVATAVGTLPLAFPYHPKTQRFYRQIGASELCVPLDRVDRNRVMRQFEMALALALRGGYRYELPSEVREAAQRNKELVKRFIEMVAGDAE